METIQTEVNLKALAIKNGLIWGVINVVIFLVTWYTVPSLMSSYAYSGLLLIIGIALAVYFCIDMRKQIGGFWSFKEALVNIFLMFLIAMAIVYVFNLLFGKYIDTTYPTTMKELVLSKSEETLKSFGMSEEDISKGLESTAQSLDKQFTPTFSQAVVGFGIASVFYFIGALIFAAIFKKNKPVFLANNPEAE